MNRTASLLLSNIVSDFKTVAWVNNPYPKYGSKQKIFGHLVNSNEVGIPGAKMYCEVHYQTKVCRYPKRGFIRTNRNGRASVEFYIGSAVKNHVVPVDVHIQYRKKHYSSITSFTPK